jgi:hypothetical protein
LNGNLESALTLSGPICLNNEQILLGREFGNFLPLAGGLDEVRIYNRALTLAEVQATMNQLLKGNEPGLVGYWRLDEGTGTNIYDASGNGNDGALPQGGPNWVTSTAGE